MFGTTDNFDYLCNQLNKQNLYNSGCETLTEILQALAQHG